MAQTLYMTRFCAISVPCATAPRRVDYSPENGVVFTTRRAENRYWGYGTVLKRNVHKFVPS